MIRRTRIPGLLDRIALETPGDIVTAASHPDLDRDFERTRGFGPLVNRVVLARLARGLRDGDEPLPSARGRDDAARREASAALEARLDPAGRPWDPETLDALGDFLLGRSVRPVGELAQEAIGRLFVADYRADADSWRAARIVDASLRSNNPLRRILWASTGAVPRAQRTLAEAVEGDAAGVHATGVAVHTFVEALEGLAGVLRDRRLAARLATRGALARGTIAPRTVVRVALRDGELAGLPLRAGTLVTFATREATARSLDPRVAFLAGSWAACPAHALVPALLTEIWFRATGERPGAPAQSSHSGSTGEGS